jgi:AraC-like DNA-binding protein
VVEVPLAVEEFDLRPVSPPDRFEAFREVLSETHLPWDICVQPTVAADFSATVRRVEFADTAIVDCAADPCSGVRKKPQIAATDREYVGLMVNLGGRELVSQLNRCVELTPGEVVIWDSRVATEFNVLEPVRKRSVFFLREELEAVCPALDRLTAVGLAKRSPAVALLAAHLEATARLLPSLDRATAFHARNATLELLAAALRPDARAGGSALRSGLHALATDYVEHHLRQRTLTPSRVATDLHVSLRSLQLAFEEHGDSVAAFIRRRRLARARADLGRAGSGSVTEIAFRWGFVDSGHFARVFRQAYGIPPSAARRAGLPERELAGSAALRE